MTKSWAIAFATKEHADQAHFVLANEWGLICPPSAPPYEVVKPLDDPRLQELFGSAILGALVSGNQNTSPPPEGHWLQMFWDIGRAEAVMKAPLTDAQIDAIQAEYMAGLSNDPRRFARLIERAVLSNAIPEGTV